MSTPSSVERSKKRSREENDDSPTTPTTASTAAPTASDDSIAHFLATLSPPSKVARTSLPFVSRPLPASNWHSLPAALIPLICQHFSSWRDLLRLSRIHHCFHDCILSSTAAVHCWQNLSAIRVRLDRTNGSGATHTIVTINDRPLLFSGDEDGSGQQRALFRCLRYVPRLSWSGRLDYAQQWLAALSSSDFSTLQHLHIHSLTSPQWPTARPPPLRAMWRSFDSLVSLTLDSTHHLLVDSPSSLHGLSIRYLSAPTDVVEALLTTDHLASSPLAASLAYMHCSGNTLWLPWALPALPGLQHVHATERTTIRSRNQRFVSHKRPVAVGSSGSGGSSESRLVSYAVRQGEEWLHSGLTFPALVCLSLHGKDLLELPVLLTLSELPSLRQLTLSRRAPWSTFHERRSLPLASVWLPQLSGVDYLDVQCEQSIDTDWLTDLLFASADAEAEAAMGAVRQRLRHLSLQLPTAMDEKEASNWRLLISDWPELQHCTLAWTDAQGADATTMEARNMAVTESVVGGARACRREQVIAERADRQWICNAGVQEWKRTTD